MHIYKTEGRGVQLQQPLFSKLDRIAYNIIYMGTSLIHHHETGALVNLHNNSTAKLGRCQSKEEVGSLCVCESKGVAQNWIE